MVVSIREDGCTSTVKTAVMLVLLSTFWVCGGGATLSTHCAPRRALNARRIQQRRAFIAEFGLPVVHEAVACAIVAPLSKVETAYNPSLLSPGSGLPG